MIPRLQRFYGGNIDWLNISFKMLNAYMIMLPIIQAEESLLSININAVAGGNLKKEDNTKIINALNEQAQKRDEKRIMNTDEKIIALSGMGIPVVDKRTKKKSISPDN